MTTSYVLRTDPAAAIVGGLLGGLVVAGSVLAFFAVHGTCGEDHDDRSRAVAAEIRAQRAGFGSPRVTTAEHARPLPRRPAPPPGAEQAIVCAEEHRCTLDRAYLDELLADPVTLTSQLRVMPSVRDGVMRGVKLYGIRPGSLPKLLGLRNGDLVVSINGVAVNGMDAASGTYRRLRRVDTLAVEIERKGARLVKTCELR